MESGIQQGRPPRNLDTKVVLFRRFESGESIEDVKANAGVSEYIVYEAYRAFQIAQKSKSPGSSTTEANDQSCDETHQDDRTGSNDTSVAMTTSGDKAS